MTRRSISAIGIVAAISMVAGTAQALKVGTYSGQSADGSTITAQVTGSGGSFYLSSMNVSFAANCTNPVGTDVDAWDFILGQQVASGTNNFHSGSHYYDIRGTFSFPQYNVIKGTIVSRTAVFVPGADPPVKAQFCKSPLQSFTLHWQSAPQAATVSPGTAVAHADR